MGKEFWVVDVAEKGWCNEEFYVFAKSAGEAERKAIDLSKKKLMKDAHIVRVEFMGYIE